MNWKENIKNANLILLIISLYLPAISLHAGTDNNRKADSLFNIARNPKLHDTIRLEAYKQLIIFSHRNEPDVFEIAKKEVEKIIPGSSATKYIGYIYYEAAGYYKTKKPDYSNALKNIDKAIYFHEKGKNYFQLEHDYRYKAREIYMELGMLPESLENMKKMVHCAQLANQGGYSFRLYELGWYETYNDNADSAYKHLKMSYDLVPEDNGLRQELLIWMANTFDARKMYDSALHYLSVAIKRAARSKDETALNEAYRYKAFMLYKNNQKDTAVFYLTKNVNHYFKMQDDRLLYVVPTLCNWLIEQNKIKEAHHIITLVEDTTRNISYIRNTSSRMGYLKAKAELELAEGLHKAAALHLKELLTLQTQENKIMRENDVREQTIKSDFLKQQELLKIEQQKKESENLIVLSRQKNFLIGLSVVILFTFILLFVSVRNNRQKKRSLKIISLQKIEVEKQKLLAESKQKEILDSIHYAKRIQTAIIASEYYIKKELGRLNKFSGSPSDKSLHKRQA